MEDGPTCVECGTCCFSTMATYVRLDGDDHCRLGDRADDLTAFVGNRLYMRMAEGHCAALTMDLTSGRFLCSVYAERPLVCRELARGSAACRGEIERKGLRPMTLLRAKRAEPGALGVRGVARTPTGRVPPDPRRLPSVTRYDSTVSEEERRARAEARRGVAVLRRGRVGVDEVDLSPVSGLDAITLATRLSAESWAMSGLPDPVLARRDLPVRFVRRG